jgi:hypothetical protein
MSDGTEKKASVESLCPEISVGTPEKLQELHQKLTERLYHEDTLLNSRFQYFLLFNSFLLAGYVAGLKDFPNLSLAISIAAMVTAFMFWQIFRINDLTIRIYRHHVRMTEHKGAFPVDMQLKITKDAAGEMRDLPADLSDEISGVRFPKNSVAFFGNKRRPILTEHIARYIPIGVLFFWIVLLVVSCCRWQQTICQTIRNS